METNRLIVEICRNRTKNSDSLTEEILMYGKDLGSTSSFLRTGKRGQSQTYSEFIPIRVLFCGIIGAVGPRRWVDVAKRDANGRIGFVQFV